MLEFYDNLERVREDFAKYENKDQRAGAMMARIIALETELQHYRDRCSEMIEKIIDMEMQ
jgi:hypothetical protein